MLTIDLVPRGTWGNNVRSMVTAMEWDIIRHEVYRRANYTCEACGMGANKLHCHEVFEYRLPNKQVLVRFEALCPKCHEVKHYGRTQVLGHGDAAKEWLAKVNEWDDFEVQEHISEAFIQWHRRNNTKWQLDISYLHKFMKGNP